MNLLYFIVALFLLCFTDYLTFLDLWLYVLIKIYASKGLVVSTDVHYLHTYIPFEVSDMYQYLGQEYHMRSQGPVF